MTLSLMILKGFYIDLPENGKTCTQINIFIRNNILSHLNNERAFKSEKFSQPLFNFERFYKKFTDENKLLHWIEGSADVRN